MRQARRAPHTTSPAGKAPATHNLASISTLARTVIIWKDRGGFRAVGAEAWAQPGPPWLLQPRTLRGPAQVCQEAEGWSGLVGVKPLPQASPAWGHLERTTLSLCPDLLAWGKRGP